MRHEERRAAAQILLLKKLGREAAAASKDGGAVYEGELTAREQELYEQGVAYFIGEKTEADAQTLQKFEALKKETMTKWIGLSMLLAQGALNRDIIARATEGIEKWQGI